MTEDMMGTRVVAEEFGPEMAEGSSVVELRSVGEE